MTNFTYDILCIGELLSSSNRKQDPGLNLPKAVCMLLLGEGTFRDIDISQKQQTLNVSKTKIDCCLKSTVKLNWDTILVSSVGFELYHCISRVHRYV
jgi:hypothetical protein